jgi:hypothetical protein
MGSGEIVVVSICVSCVNTTDGVVRRRPDFSSRKMKRSVGSAGMSVVPPDHLEGGLKGHTRFFHKHAKKCFTIF